MKLKLTVAAFLLSAGSAFAGCYTPELEFSISHELGKYNDYSNSDRYDLSNRSNESYDSSERYGLDDSYGSDSSYDYGNSYGKDRGNSSDITFGISLNIPLGKTVKDLCAAEIAQARADVRTEVEEERKKRAERRERDSKARAQELDNLQQKIAICSEFELDTAPKSIKNLCGDLLQ